jgi:AraC family transcriptional regulator
MDFAILVFKEVQNMHAWESIQSTLGWIEENLSEHAEIEKLAEIAHLSPFYYQRLFSRLVGKPVMEYMKLRRLANAADQLANNPRKIVDVAFAYGFENHETFSRAFKEAYGLTPEEYRKVPRPLSHFLMPELSLMYQLIDENVPLVADGVVLEIRRTQLDAQRYFSGLSVQNPMSDVPGIDFLSELWKQVHVQKQDIANLLPGGNELGMSTPGIAEGCFSYFAGAEISCPDKQTGYEHMMMPSGSYAACAVEAENFYLLTTNALNKARDYMLGVWLPNHKISIDPFMAELYGDTSPESSSMEIWFRTKQQIIS